MVVIGLGAGQGGDGVPGQHGGPGRLQQDRALRGPGPRGGGAQHAGAGAAGGCIQEFQPTALHNTIQVLIAFSRQ